MDFHLSKEHLLVRKMYREFAENEVKPLAEELDEEERFPMETVEKMAKLGMMGIYFPKQYGGAGGDVLSYAMCVEELAKVCGTTAVVVSAHTSLCCAPIFENGTEEQKMKYLPDLLSGRKIGAFGLTEPGAGTDASGQQTTAVKKDVYKRQLSVSRRTLSACRPLPGPWRTSPLLTTRISSSRFSTATSPSTTTPRWPTPLRAA